MPMNTPRRNWLQIHLSTAIILMFAAGGILWANTRAQVRYKNAEFAYAINSYGWPREALTYFSDTVIESNGGLEIVRTPYRKWRFWNTAEDALFAFAILLSVGVACEVWIRRRAGRKGA